MPNSGYFSLIAAINQFNWEKIFFSPGPFSFHIGVNNLFFILCDSFFFSKTGRFCCVWAKNCSWKFYSIIFFSLNCEAPTHHSDPHIQVFWNAYNAHIRYLEYHCDVPCCVTSIIFSQRFNLVFITDCKPTGRFSIFQIKIPTFESNELLTKNTISYGTISINGTHHFCCLNSVCFFFFENNRASNNETTYNFSSIFAYNKKRKHLNYSITYTHHVERCLEIRLFRIGINIINCS